MPRLVLTLVVAVLLASSGLVGAVGGTGIAVPAGVTLADDDNGDGSGDDTAGADAQGGQGDQDDQTGEKAAAAADRDQAGNAGSAVYVAFTGNAATPFAASRLRAEAGDAGGVGSTVVEEAFQGGQFSNGSYTVQCSLSKVQNSDNPLLAPGVPNGAQHLHDYSGNNSASANSNTASLAQASSTCTNGDQSTFFWPVLRDLGGVGPDVGKDGGSLDGNKGAVIEPNLVDITFHGHGTRPVTAMPLGLVVNDGAAKSATENGEGANAKYTCSGSQQLTALYPLCPQGSAMQRVFDFPSCWDGKNLQSEKQNTHVVFPDADGNCEPGEVSVPAMRITLSYPAPQGQTFAIDSFPQEQHNPVTDHALSEYLSSERRAAAGAACINQNQHCVQGTESNPSAGGFLGPLAPQDRVPPTGDVSAALSAHLRGHHHGGVVLAGPPTLARLLGDWQLDVVFVVVIGLLVLGYGVALRRLRRRGGTWSGARTVAWAAGCALLLLATCSGWARYADAMFSVHMAQHMTLLCVVPILLGLGAPLTLARDGLPRSARHRAGAGRWARVRAGTPMRAATHPLVALTAVAAADWGVYFSGIYPLALQRHWTHTPLTLAVLAAGTFFTATVLGTDTCPRPRPATVRLGTLLVAMPLHVGFAIALLDHPVLVSGTFYRALALAWVPSVFADQHAAGAVAATVGELGLVLALAAVLGGATRCAVHGGHDDPGAGTDPYSALARRVATRVTVAATS